LRIRLCHLLLASARQQVESKSRRFGNPPPIQPKSRTLQSALPVKPATRDHAARGKSRRSKGRAVKLQIHARMLQHVFLLY
jgi:hypothetical protein